MMKLVKLGSCVLGALLLFGCSADFNPDLSSMDETGETDTDSGDTDPGETDAGTGDETGMNLDAGTSMEDCGNGILDTGEECDGNDMGEATCISEGFDEGDLNCTDECMLETSSCSMLTCQGDPDGMYGVKEACDFYFGGTWDLKLYEVCKVTCDTDNDCADPSLAACDNQPSCVVVGEGLGDCKITCNSDAECPSDMFCMMNFDPGFCVWEV